MPAKKKNTYTVEDKRCKDFPSAADMAIMLALQRPGEDVAIVEHNPNTEETYYINVSATSEKAEG